ncbi:MAG: M28 family peptidase [Gemmatimonadales bacterium]
MSLPLFLSSIIVAAALQAPPPGAGGDAVEGITAADLQHRVDVLAHDSMMGRDTPSPGLERSAAYVVAEFRRLGLRPADAAGGYVQRFGLSRWTVDSAASRVELSAGTARATARIGLDVRFVGGGIAGEAITGDALLLAGPVTTEMAESRRLEGRIVLLALDYTRPLPSDLGDRVDEIAARARAVVLLSNRDSVAFARRLETAAEPKLTPDFLDEGSAPVIEVHQRVLGAVLEAAGIDPERLRSGERAGITATSGLRVSIRLAPRYLERAQAPNVVAVLQGSDPLLRREYVAFSAHADHIGITPGRADSINNGADDNASGLAGLLELAEAFSQPGARPRRSLLFLVPSGEEKGLWGSAYFTEHPTVPLEEIVADLNMDLIGRNWPDSVIAVGLEQSTLASTLQQVVADHPELRMAPIRDRWPEERIFYRSDHYNFARKGVPILFFTSGTHPDYHQPTDAADRIDAEKASRLVRLLFHLGTEVANDPERPRWFPESYRQIVERD